MAEYIKRESIQKALKNVTDDPSCPLFLAAMIEQYIDQEPAADVVEVKHGKWIWDPNGMDWGLGAWQCSECACRNNNLPMNNRINPLVFSGSKYCPNCGAKMGAEG